LHSFPTRRSSDLQTIRYPAAKNNTNRRSKKRPGSKESNMEPRHLALVCQISREPGQKENQCSIPGKLPKTGPDNLPTGEKSFGIIPVKRNITVSYGVIVYANVRQFF